MAGEDIVTVLPRTDEGQRHELYGAYGIRDIADLGGNTFLVKLERDPGLDTTKREGIESGKVEAV